MRRLRLYKPGRKVVVVKKGRRYLFLNEQGKPVADASPRNRGWIAEYLERFGVVVELGPRLRAHKQRQEQRRPTLQQYLRQLGSTDTIIGRINRGRLRLVPFRRTELVALACDAGMTPIVDPSITHELYWGDLLLGFVDAERSLPEYWVIGNAEEGFTVMWYDWDPVFGPEIGTAGSIQWDSYEEAKAFFEKYGK